jgi:hypothetical protein
MQERDEKCVIEFARKHLEKRDHLKDLCENMEVILKYILKYDGNVWSEFTYLRMTKCFGYDN